jgi:hypothetical protein
MRAYKRKLSLQYETHLWLVKLGAWRALSLLQVKCHVMGGVESLGVDSKKATNK